MVVIQPSFLLNNLTPRHQAAMLNQNFLMLQLVFFNLFPASKNANDSRGCFQLP